MPLRPKPFWTPRYVVARLRLAYYQQRNPEVPWLCRTAAQMLPGLLCSSDRMLEWGSGRSTTWFAARVQSLHSVEHDRGWFEIVRAQLADGAFGTDVVRFASTDPADQPSASEYVRVIDEFADNELDVCLVDGAHRGACALAAVAKLSSGGLLIVDDAQWYIDRPTHSPVSRHGKGTLPGDWTAFTEMVAGWRCMWMTDGVSDTAMWIKP